MVNRRAAAAAILLAAPGLALAAPAEAASSDTSLAHAIDVVSADLGHPTSSYARVVAAKLPAPVADRLTTVLNRVHTCHTLAGPLLKTAQDRYAGGTGLDDPALVAGLDPAALLQCGANLEADVTALDSAARANRVSTSLDVWPAVRVSGGTSANLYVHDYAVQLDAGGNDRYLNNAGGSALDLVNGPAGSPAPAKAPAVGCEIAFSVLVPTCFLYNAALVDLAGNDQYGRFEAPRLDSLCTNDPVALRTTTIAGAIFGVAALRDDAGNDRYIGKTNTQGGSHFGYASFVDVAGDDTYTAVRIAHGGAQLLGTSFHRDLGGKDTYSTYSPRPKNPSAPVSAPGSGGIVDDRNQCNPNTGYVLGTGDLAGLGTFVNAGGDDHYGATPNAFGSGTREGVGSFTDTGSGADSYPSGTWASNGVTVNPSPANAGSFRDDG